MKKLLRNWFGSAKYRLTMWISYNLGCYRSITGQLKVLEDLSDEDIIKEVENVKKVCEYTGLDTDYLQNIVRVRLSAAIIQMLDIYGFDREERIITSDPDELEEMIEKWGQLGNLAIEKKEGVFSYKGRNGYSWGIECDFKNKQRFQLFYILLIIAKKM